MAETVERFPWYLFPNNYESSNSLQCSTRKTWSINIHKTIFALCIMREQAALILGHFLTSTTIFTIVD